MEKVTYTLKGGPLDGLVVQSRPCPSLTVTYRPPSAKKNAWAIDPDEIVLVDGHSPRLLPMATYRPVGGGSCDAVYVPPHPHP